jgi:hypothetical protein
MCNVPISPIYGAKDYKVADYSDPWKPPSKMPRVRAAKGPFTAPERLFSPD